MRQESVYTYLHCHVLEKGKHEARICVSKVEGCVRRSNDESKICVYKLAGCASKDEARICVQNLHCHALE